MGQYKKLDNLSGQAIKEMINSKEITIEELDMRALSALFDYESELVCAGESDDELLQQIAKLLDPMVHTHEAEQKYRQLIRSALEPKTISEAPAKRKGPRLRKVLIIAATFLVLMIGVSVIAEALGFGVFAFFRKIVGISGARLDNGSVTLVYWDKTEEYHSVEDLLLSEELNILYPTVLPKNVSIISVYISDTENGGKSISFFTGNASTSIVVDTCAGIQPEDYTECELYHADGYDFYLFEESGYFAVCYDKNNLYRIRSTSRENIILIIEHMKEFG